MKNEEQNNVISNFIDLYRATTKFAGDHDDACSAIEIATLNVQDILVEEKDNEAGFRKRMAAFINDENLRNATGAAGFIAGLEYARKVITVHCEISGMWLDDAISYVLNSAMTSLFSSFEDAAQKALDKQTRETNEAIQKSLLALANNAARQHAVPDNTLLTPEHQFQAEKPARMQ